MLSSSNRLFTPTTRAKINRTNYASSIDSHWFLNVETIETAKPIRSLLDIWKHLSQKQIDIWTLDEDDSTTTSSTFSDPEVTHLSKQLIYRLAMIGSTGSTGIGAHTTTTTTVSSTGTPTTATATTMMPPPLQQHHHPSHSDHLSVCSSSSSLSSLVEDYAEDAWSLDACLEQIMSLENKEKAFRILHCAIRVIHIKIHLSDLENESMSFLKPKKFFLKRADDNNSNSYSTASVSAGTGTGGTGSGGSAIIGDDRPLRSRLVLQSYLSFLENEYARNGNDLSETFHSFEQFINECRLRLVSTVHPNETERSTNLLHYTRILDLYIKWRREWASIQSIVIDSPEYRIRREQLNQLRRRIKAEIESVWQSDQLRLQPITVTAEARRLMDRYRIIFESFPVHQKLCKQLVMEAYWLFNASVVSRSNERWIQTFTSLWMSITKATRADRVATVKKTFRQLNMDHSLPPRPKLLKPVIQFATWKGGDRDGNPFVNAAFTNQTFIEQKVFVLEYYTQMVRSMVDTITPSLNNTKVSQSLLDSVKLDAKKFPFIDTVKFQEPYRAKLRYILEKLTNTLHRTSEIAERTGEATKPLLSLTLPGPSGYSTSDELAHDVNIIYDSLLANDSKSQARSQVQDLKILVETFGLHMCSVDFRQVSTQNQSTVVEYLNLIGHPSGKVLLESRNEGEKRRLLMELILSSELELDPSILRRMSRVSRDTLQSLLLYADAMNTDPNMVGKFIISMCQDVSDILIVMVLLKLGGMASVVHTDTGPEIVCHQDITGLFETVDDLKNAPTIVQDLLDIPLIRQYIAKYRHRTLTIMLGYSDSVRDGSALCSDAQVARACIELGKLEQRLNASQLGGGIRFAFYRGRGDSLPRGYGGNIKRSIASQSYTTRSEDHTEQNRYLRKYATASSALDHFHDVYSAHLSSVVNQTLSTSPLNTHPLYQTLFELCGHLSHYKWRQLVSSEGTGDLYFSILAKYSILPILPECQFASRPVCRSGVSFNIDNVRAIPFAMLLGQMREFSVAYYGCGTAFDQASILFEHINLPVVLYHLMTNSSQEQGTPQSNAPLSLQLIHLLEEIGVSPDSNLQTYGDASNALEQTYPALREQDSEQGKQIASIISILAKYYSSSNAELLTDFVNIALVLKEKRMTFGQMLREMYQEYAPFKYSIENKIHSLLIRNKRIVDEYTQHASAEEKELLNETEREAQATLKWTNMIEPSIKTRDKLSKRNYESADLEIIHRVQSLMLRRFHEMQSTQKSYQLSQEQKKMVLYLQMTILSISEALGFGG